MRYHNHITIYDRRLYFALKYFTPVLNKYRENRDYMKWSYIFRRYILPRLTEFLDNVKINK